MLPVPLSGQKIRQIVRDVDNTARVVALSSSRTFPGPLVIHQIRMASGDSDRSSVPFSSINARGSASREYLHAVSLALFNSGRSH